MYGTLRREDENNRGEKRNGKKTGIEGKFGEDYILKRMPKRMRGGTEIGRQREDGRTMKQKENQARRKLGI